MATLSPQLYPWCAFVCVFSKWHVSRKQEKFFHHSQCIVISCSHHLSKQSSIAPNCVSESLIYACTSNFLSHAITNLKVPLIFLFYDSTSCLWYFLQLKWYSTTENASIVGILRYFNKDKRLSVIFQHTRLLALNFNNQLLHTHFGPRQPLLATITGSIAELRITDRGRSTITPVCRVGEMFKLVRRTHHEAICRNLSENSPISLAEKKIRTTTKAEWAFNRVKFNYMLPISMVELKK